MKRMIAATVVVGVITLAAVACDWTTAGNEQNTANGVPLAALMYLWFGFDLNTGESIGGLKSSHWNTDTGNLGSRVGVTDEPEYGFYASDDASVIVQQLADMEEAGISVILLSWWGSGDSDLDGVNENKESEAMVRAANVLVNYVSDNSAPFKVALLVEPYMPRPEGITLAQKQSILDELWSNVYNAYPDLMFQWEGKPLLVTWAPLELKTPNDPRFTVKTWGSYFGAPDWKIKSGQDRNWYPDPAWLPHMISDDGMYVVLPRFDEYWLYIMGRESAIPIAEWTRC